MDNIHIPSTFLVQISAKSANIYCQIKMHCTNSSQNGRYLFPNLVTNQKINICGLKFSPKLSIFVVKTGNKIQNKLVSAQIASDRSQKLYRSHTWSKFHPKEPIFVAKNGIKIKSTCTNLCKFDPKWPISFAKTCIKNKLSKFQPKQLIFVTKIGNNFNLQKYFYLEAPWPPVIGTFSLLV